MFSLFVSDFPGTTFVMGRNRPKTSNKKYVTYLHILTIFTSAGVYPQKPFQIGSIFVKIVIFIFYDIFWLFLGEIGAYLRILISSQ